MDRCVDVWMDEWMDRSTHMLVVHYKNKHTRRCIAPSSLSCWRSQFQHHGQICSYFPVSIHLPKSTKICFELKTLADLPHTRFTVNFTI